MNDDTAQPPTPAQSAAANVAGEKPKPLPKRFYTSVSTQPDSADARLIRILLDGRPMRTPAKQHLAVPGFALAEAIAEEWRAQVGVIDPAKMPLTRLANTALDGVTGREAEVRADIVQYAGSDLVCYLADAPDDLLARQTAAWAPIHQWVAKELGVELKLAHAITHVAQSPDLQPRIEAAVQRYDAFALSALHVITTMTGSALLALALARRHLDADTAWTLAHVDEDYQAQKWGQDAAAVRRHAIRAVEFHAACRLLALPQN